MELNIDEKYCIIDEFPDYIVTENGNIFSYRNGKTGWNGLRKLKLKGTNNPKKYLQVTLCNKLEHKYIQVHRIVAKYFCDGFFDGAVVNHKNANIHDNRYVNLEWVTQKENIHKSYENSGINQYRNYKLYDLICPNGLIIEKILRCDLIEYSIKFNFSFTGIVRNSKSKGYKIKKYDKPQ